MSRPLPHHVVAGPRVRSALVLFFEHHPHVTMTALAKAARCHQSLISSILRGDKGDLRTGTVDRLRLGMRMLRAKAE